MSPFGVGVFGGLFREASGVGIEDVGEVFDDLVWFEFHVDGNLFDGVSAGVSVEDVQGLCSDLSIVSFA